MGLLDGLGLGGAGLKQPQIADDVGIAGGAAQRLIELFVGPRVVAAQHVGIALVVEDLDLDAGELGGLRVGAIGEVEAFDVIVGRGEIEPGLGVVRMLLDGAAEVALGHAVIAAAEIGLAGRQIVGRIGAEQIALRRRFAERLALEEARAFATLINQSIDLGSSITDALRVYSDDMRHKRMASAEEKAYALPAKLAVPMMICIFPVLFVVILLPVFVRLSVGHYF